MSKSEYLNVPKGMKYTESGKLGLIILVSTLYHFENGHDVTAYLISGRIEMHTLF